MTPERAASAAASESATKNPYNTRRKSLYFSPATHSASVPDTDSSSAAQISSTKHVAHHPEANPRSPKRLRRLGPVDGSLTPPPSPPSNAVPFAPAATGGQTTAAVGLPAPGYDEEDDPVINAIVHVLQLSDNAPLSTRDLSSSILEYRLCELDSPNPSSVVSSRITSHLKRRAAEKPPREPLLTRFESENGRKRTEYHLKYPDLVSDRSKLYANVKRDVPETKVLRAVTASKLNILSSDPLELDSDEYDSEDSTNRSPDRPTLFDPPAGVSLSPVYDHLLSPSIMVDIDVPTGIKLDHEFDQAIPSIPIENLTPPSEEASYPSSPLREVFSRRSSPVEPSDIENLAPADPPEADDPQSPHSGAPDNTNLPSAFYESLLYHSVQTQTEEVEMFEANGEDEGDDDEVRVVEMQPERTTTKHYEGDLTWEERKDGAHVPSPENVGVDELEEWLEGL